MFSSRPASVPPYLPSFSVGFLREKIACNVDTRISQWRITLIARDFMKLGEFAKRSEYIFEHLFHRSNQNMFEEQSILIFLNEPFLIDSQESLPSVEYAAEEKYMSDIL